MDDIIPTNSTPSSSLTEQPMVPPVMEPAVPEPTPTPTIPPMPSAPIQSPAPPILPTPEPITPPTPIPTDYYAYLARRKCPCDINGI